MKRRTQTLFLSLLLYTFCLLISFVPQISATDTDYDALYREGAGPTIDGNISSSEWRGSKSYELTFQYSGEGTIKAVLYLLHNGSALFLGLNMTILDATNDNNDSMIIYIDENNNGNLDNQINRTGEEGIRLMRDGNYIDLSYNGSKWIDDESVSGTKGPSYGATNGVNGWEFYFPTGTNNSDFNEDLPSKVLDSAKKIGINIEYYNDTGGSNKYDSCTTLTNGTENLTAANWDNLICGALESPTNYQGIWIFIIIAMIIPLAVVLYILIWMIRKEKTY